MRLLGIRCLGIIVRGLLLSCEVRLWLAGWICELLRRSLRLRERHGNAPCGWLYIDVDKLPISPMMLITNGYLFDGCEKLSVFTFFLEDTSNSFHKRDYIKSSLPMMVSQTGHYHYAATAALLQGDLNCSRLLRGLS